MQCAQRWEELVLASNAPLAGDFSGLTATGRPISGYRYSKRSTKMSPSIHDQSSRASVHDVKRPRSVVMSGQFGNEGRSEEDVMVPRSISMEDRVWGRMSQQEEERRLNYRVNQMTREKDEMASRATFAASFCQNLLNKGKDAPVSLSDAQSGFQDRNKPQERGESRKSEMAAAKASTTK